MSDEALYAAAAQRKEEAFREKVTRFQREVEQRSADRVRLRREIDEITAKQGRLPQGAKEADQLSRDKDAKEAQLHGLEHTALLLEQVKAQGPEPTERDSMVARTKSNADRFAWIAFADILVFFPVGLVGFAYLGRRGDLDWVRSTA